MTALIDAGPIVALFDRDQPQHDECVAAILTTNEPLVTCEAVIAEASYQMR